MEREADIDRERIWDQVQLCLPASRDLAQLWLPCVRTHSTNQVKVSPISRVFHCDREQAVGPLQVPGRVYAIYLYPNQFQGGCRTLSNRICCPSYTKMRHLTPVGLGEARPSASWPRS